MKDEEKWLEKAQSLDAADPLREWRDQFYFPQKDGEDLIYLCGNSLGLQPKSVEKFVQQELEDWKKHGVEGHFEGKNAWYYYHHFLEEAAARLVGADKKEVVVMNSLTVNLHLLMISFYRPEGQRKKILIESPAFPSDQYAVDSHAKLHGFYADDVVVEMFPREGEETIRTEDILQQITDLGDELALVMIGGVNYYTGQFFELEKITAAAHAVGAFAGFDLAHAAGNVPLELHDWGVDFAVWCSYKYLNSGPGGTSGAFVHERHGNNPDLVRLAGWWGNDEKTRFQMPRKFIPQEGAAGWQISNAQVFSMAPHMASLEIFDEVGMPALRAKSLKLTGFLEEMLDAVNAEAGNQRFKIITPRDSHHRGCQLSILVDGGGKQVFEALTADGIVADWREPNVIRLAPVPLYNKFEEAFRFVRILSEC